MLFCDSAIYFLASKKKIDFLRQLEGNAPSDFTDATVKFLIRDKADNDKNNFQKITEAIKGSKEGKNMGVITKDAKFPGAFMDSWRKHWSANSGDVSSVDVMNGLTYLMAPKEESELANVKKAAQVTSDVFSKYLKEQIMDIIDNDKKVKHSKLAEGVEKAFTEKKYAPNLDINHLETCYPVIVQSGGNYKLKFSVVSDKENVHFGAIICSFGARYKSYCSNIVRTMLVNPSDKVQKSYDFLVSLEEHILANLKEGAVLKDVYESTVRKVKNERPDLVDKLTKNFGFSMGIEFRDAPLSITSSCTAKVKNGMVFNVNIGFSPIVNKAASDSKGKDIALFIGDTVLVTGDDPAQILTTSKKKIKNIAIFLKDADSSEGEKENKGLPDPEAFGRGKRTAVLEQKLRQDTTADEKRKVHQR